MEERYDMHCQSIALNKSCSFCSCHVFATVYAQAFFTSAMDEWSVSYIERLVPGVRTHLMGGRMCGPLHNRIISPHSYSPSLDVQHSMHSSTYSIPFTAQVSMSMCR